MIISPFGLYALWGKHYKLIFLSGICLLVAFISFVIISTVQLTKKYCSMKISDRIKLIVQVAIESFFQLIAILITFFMSTIKPSKFEMNIERCSLKDTPIKEDNGLDI